MYKCTTISAYIQLFMDFMETYGLIQQRVLVG